MKYFILCLGILNLVLMVSIYLKYREPASNTHMTCIFYIDGEEGDVSAEQKWHHLARVCVPVKKGEK